MGDFLLLQTSVRSPWDSCKRAFLYIIVCFLFVLVGRLVRAFIIQSVHPYACPSVRPAVLPSFRVSICLYIRLSICSSVRPFPRLFVCSFAHLPPLMSESCSCPDLSVFFSLLLQLLMLKTFFLTYFLLKYVLFTNSLDCLASSFNVIIIECFYFFREIAVDLLFVKKIMASGYCEV